MDPHELSIDIRKYDDNKTSDVKSQHTYYFISFARFTIAQYIVFEYVLIVLMIDLVIITKYQYGPIKYAFIVFLGIIYTYAHKKKPTYFLCAN